MERVGDGEGGGMESVVDGECGGMERAGDGEGGGWRGWEMERVPCPSPACLALVLHTHGLFLFSLLSLSVSSNSKCKVATPRLAAPNHRDWCPPPTAPAVHWEKLLACSSVPQGIKQNSPSALPEDYFFSPVPFPRALPSHAASQHRPLEAPLPQSCFMPHCALGKLPKPSHGSVLP